MVAGSASPNGPRVVFYARHSLTCFLVAFFLACARLMYDFTFVSAVVHPFVVTV